MVEILRCPEFCYLGDTSFDERGVVDEPQK